MGELTGWRFVLEGKGGLCMIMKEWMRDMEEIERGLNKEKGQSGWIYFSKGLIFLINKLGKSHWV